MNAFLDLLSAFQTRHPLLLFMMLGALVFALHRGAADNEDPAGQRPIRISAEQLAQLQERFPDQDPASMQASQLREVLGDWLIQQVLVREALRLGLEHADPIIERRLSQKMQVLLEDLHPVAEPDDATLQAWLDAHAAQYGEPPRYSFEQVFLSRDKYGSETAGIASEYLQLLRAGKASHQELGDPFMTGATLVHLSQRDIRKHFGRQFSEALVSLLPGEWNGPIRSGYGTHLVRITEIQPFQTYSLEQARDQVLRDYQAEQRRIRNEALFDQLIRSYPLVLPATGSAA